MVNLLSLGTILARSDAMVFKNWFPKMGKAEGFCWIGSNTLYDSGLSLKTGLSLLKRGRGPLQDHNATVLINRFPIRRVSVRLDLAFDLLIGQPWHAIE